jgi:hypothetical protein
MKIDLYWPHPRSVTLEIVEGLPAILTAIQRLTRRTAKLADQCRMIRVAMRTGHSLLPVK